MRRAAPLILLAASLVCWSGLAVATPPPASVPTPVEIDLQKIYDATPNNGTISLPAGSWPLAADGQAFSPARTDPGKSVLWMFRGAMDAGSGAASAAAR